MTDRGQETAEAEQSARRAARLGADDAVALCQAGFALAFVVGDLNDGAALIDRALVLNTKLATAQRSADMSEFFLASRSSRLIIWNVPRPSEPARSAHLHRAEWNRAGSLLRQPLPRGAVVYLL